MRMRFDGRAIGSAALPIDRAAGEPPRFRFTLGFLKNFSPDSLPFPSHHAVVDGLIGPYLSGRSLQGAPVRKIQIIPLRAVLEGEEVQAVAIVRLSSRREP